MQKKMDLSYAVVGTGAIGGYFGAKLAKAGKRVHFLLHSDYAYVKEHGLRIRSVRGSFHLPKVLAYDKSEDMPPVDVVLVGLKTTNNALLSTILPPLLHEKTVVIAIQNGIGVEEDLAKEFPSVSIAGGLAFIASNKLGPGEVLHQDLGRLSIAYHGEGDLSILEQVCSDFTMADVSARLDSDLASARWHKLLWNIPYNGLSVALNATTDVLMECSSSRSLVKDLMEEVRLASLACGVQRPLTEEDIEKMLVMTSNMPPYAPSMKLDYDYKRPMEIVYMYKRPVEIAQSFGYKMSKTEALGQMLEFLEAKHV